MIDLVDKIKDFKMSRDHSLAGLQRLQRQQLSRLVEV